MKLKASYSFKDSLSADDPNFDDSIKSAVPSVRSASGGASINTEFEFNDSADLEAAKRHAIYRLGKLGVNSDDVVFEVTD